MTTPPRSRQSALILSSALLLSAFLPAPGSCLAASLITEAEARSQGLTRKWYSQAPIDPSRHAVERVTLAGKQVMVLTSSGVLQAIDAETGATQWTTRVGNPNYPSLGPAVGKRHVAVVNGSTVFALDRTDGREAATFRVTGGAAAAPAICDGYVYTPLFNGRVEAFAIAPQATDARGWNFSSRGRLYQPPVAAATSVAWANDRGRIFVANAKDSGARYWFEGGSPFVAPPTALGESIYAATEAGYVYALEEKSGRRRWRYAAGAPVLRSPVALAGEVLVATEAPALHSLDPATGDTRWRVDGVAQFVAASEERIYGLDAVGGLVVLDRETGGVASRVPGRGENTAVLNDQSDRLYVFSRDGLLQCFHEIDADEPYYHRPIADASAGSGTKEGSGTKAGSGAKPGSGTKEGSSSKGEGSATKPDTEPVADDPFGEGGDDAGDDDDPFNGGDDPFGGDAGGDAGGDNPFGGDDDEDPFGL